MSAQIPTTLKINARVVSDDMSHRLIPATQWVLSRYSAAHNACGELDLLAHHNKRSDGYLVLAPPIAFASSRLT